MGRGGWKCPGCGHTLVVEKRILDRGGAHICRCGQKVDFSKKSNGKIKVSY